MWKKALQLLLWVFLLGNGGLIYKEALAKFMNTATTMQDWIGLSLGAIFLLVPAALLYEFGAAGLAYMVTVVKADHNDAA